MLLNSKNLTSTDNLDTDVIIYGAPFEGESTWGDYTGVELGPKQIRVCSARYSQYLPELNHIDISEHLTMGDVGDVPLLRTIINKATKTLKNSLKSYGKVRNF